MNLISSFPSFFLIFLDLLINGLDRKPNSSCLNAVQTLTAEVDVGKVVSTPSEDATCRPVRATPRESGRKVKADPACARLDREHGGPHTCHLLSLLMRSDFVARDLLFAVVADVVIVVVVVVVAASRE